jgi:flagellar basal body-associated protein FliL
MDLANNSNQEPYEKTKSASGGASKVVGLGIVSVASAIAGGLAMAWWHRKTLSKLQNPIASVDRKTPQPQNAGPKIE